MHYHHLYASLHDRRYPVNGVIIIFYNPNHRNGIALFCIANEREWLLFCACIRLTATEFYITRFVLSL